MKKCPQCAELVHDDATVCRFCGFKLSALDRFGDRLNQIGCVGTAVLALLIFYGLSQCQSSNDKAADETTPAMAQAEKFFAEEDAVKLRLRDPDSAEFRHLTTGCGYVNSRNGFGGMSGMTAYVIDPLGAPVFSADDTAKFKPLWRQKCAGLPMP